MNTKNTTFLLGTVALVIIGLLLYSNYEKDKRIKELNDTLKSNNLISEKIKEQLLELLEKHPHIDEDVKEELKQIALLIGIQQETKAILSLAKIVENLLKKLFKNDTDFKAFVKANKKGRAVFADYLDYAKDQKIIPAEDYHLISVLKTIRNEEAHELNVLKDKAKLVGCFISGIGVVLSLYNLVKRTLFEKEEMDRLTQASS